MLLSACLIVKNEERFLDACLVSVAPFVDEIIVVDTGSTDRTMKIASEMGARVFQIPWKGDFAAARNYSLRRARGEWILWLDADETIRACRPQGLRKLLSDPLKAALWVKYYPRPGYTPVWRLRVFRNHRLIRFRDAYHEEISTGIEKYCARFGGSPAFSPLVFDHFGFEGNQRRKRLRDAKLLEKFLETNPNRIYHACHLAIVYEQLGQAKKAYRILNPILERVRRLGPAQPFYVLAYAAMIKLRLKDLQAKRSAPGLLELANEAAALFPNNPEILWLKGTVLKDLSLHRQAVKAFNHLIDTGRRSDRCPDFVLTFSESYFGSLPRISLASCYYSLGDYKRAAMTYRQLLRSDPENAEYRRMELLCKMRTRGSKDT